MTISAVDAIRGRKTRSGRIRVLIVDDSLVLRHLITQALREDPEIEVVGAEAEGGAALKKIPVVAPDVVILDIEMPGMDGLETLKHIRKLHPHLRTVMFSTLTTRGASATFEALSLGADDYVAKGSASGPLDRSLTALRTELIPKIKQFFTSPTTAGDIPPAPRKFAATTHRTKVGVLAIGVSTGGPQALAELIPNLPANFPVPIVIVQHMPAMFTRLLAERLRASSAVNVVEAVDGMELRPGCAIIAQGDYHLNVCRTGSVVVAKLDQGPRVNFCRPSVDVLFHSLANVYRAEVLSVMLTGMGSDGLHGTEALKAVGAYALVQDEASSVVWGMPGAVANAGLADQILPLQKIAPEIVRLVRG